MRGQDHCCVGNCTNRRSNLPKDFAFHQIPGKSLARRNAWIRSTALKRGSKKGELTITEHTNVCGSYLFVDVRVTTQPILTLFQQINYLFNVTVQHLNVNEKPTQVGVLLITQTLCKKGLKTRKN